MGKEKRKKDKDRSRDAPESESRDERRSQRKEESRDSDRRRDDDRRDRREPRDLDDRHDRRDRDRDKRDDRYRDRDHEEHRSRDRDYEKDQGRSGDRARHREYDRERSDRDNRRERDYDPMAKRDYEQEHRHERDYERDQRRDRDPEQDKRREREYERDNRQERNYESESRSERDRERNYERQPRSERDSGHVREREQEDKLRDHERERGREREHYNKMRMEEEELRRLASRDEYERRDNRTVGRQEEISASSRSDRDYREREAREAYDKRREPPTEQIKSRDYEDKTEDRKYREYERQPSKRYREDEERQHEEGRRDRSREMVPTEEEPRARRGRRERFLDDERSEENSRRQRAAEESHHGRETRDMGELRETESRREDRRGRGRSQTERDRYDRNRDQKGESSLKADLNFDRYGMWDRDEEPEDKHSHQNKYKDEGHYSRNDRRRDSPPKGDYMKEAKTLTVTVSNVQRSPRDSYDHDRDLRRQPSDQGRNHDEENHYGHRSKTQADYEGRNKEKADLGRRSDMTERGRESERSSRGYPTEDRSPERSRRTKERPDREDEDRLYRRSPEPQRERSSRQDTQETSSKRSSRDSRHASKDARADSDRKFQRPASRSSSSSDSSSDSADDGDHRMLTDKDQRKKKHKQEKKEKEVHRSGSSRDPQPSHAPVGAVTSGVPQPVAHPSVYDALYGHLPPPQQASIPARKDPKPDIDLYDPIGKPSPPPEDHDGDLWDTAFSMDDKPTNAPGNAMTEDELLYGESLDIDPKPVSQHISVLDTKSSSGGGTDLYDSLLPPAAASVSLYDPAKPSPSYDAMMPQPVAAPALYASTMPSAKGDASTGHRYEKEAAAAKKGDHPRIEEKQKKKSRSRRRQEDDQPASEPKQKSEDVASTEYENLRIQLEKERLRREYMELELMRTEMEKERLEIARQRSSSPPLVAEASSSKSRAATREKYSPDSSQGRGRPKYYEPPPATEEEQMGYNASQLAENDLWDTAFDLDEKQTGSDGDLWDSAISMDLPAASTSKAGVAKDYDPSGSPLYQSEGAPEGRQDPVPDSTTSGSGDKTGESFEGKSSGPLEDLHDYSKGVTIELKKHKRVRDSDDKSRRKERSPSRASSDSTSSQQKSAPLPTPPPVAVPTTMPSVPVAAASYPISTAPSTAAALHPHHAQAAIAAQYAAAATVPVPPVSVPPVSDSIFSPFFQKIFQEDAEKQAKSTPSSNVAVLSSQYPTMPPAVLPPAAMPTDVASAYPAGMSNPPNPSPYAAPLYSQPSAYPVTGGDVDYRAHYPHMTAPPGDHKVQDKDLRGRHGSRESSRKRSLSPPDRKRLQRSRSRDRSLSRNRSLSRDRSWSRGRSRSRDARRSRERSRSRGSRERSRSKVDRNSRYRSLSREPSPGIKRQPRKRSWSRSASPERRRRPSPANQHKSRRESFDYQSPDRERRRRSPSNGSFSPEQHKRPPQRSLDRRSSSMERVKRHKSGSPSAKKPRHRSQTKEDVAVADSTSVVKFYPGMLCPVTSCSREFFIDKERFDQHWRSLHLPYKERFNCKLCTDTHYDSRPSKLHSHFAERHKAIQLDVLGKEVLSNMLQMLRNNNDEYRDPTPHSYDCPTEVEAVIKMNSSQPPSDHPAGPGAPMPVPSGGPAPPPGWQGQPPRFPPPGVALPGLPPPGVPPPHMAPPRPGLPPFQGPPPHRPPPFHQGPPPAGPPPMRQPMPGMPDTRAPPPGPLTCPPPHQGPPPHMPPNMPPGPMGPGGMGIPPGGQNPPQSPGTSQPGSSSLIEPPRSSANKVINLKPQRKVFYSPNMRCLVFGCDKKTIYKTEAMFAAHWKKVHVSPEAGHCHLCMNNDETFICPLNPKYFPDISRHFREKHPKIRFTEEGIQLIIRDFMYTKSGEPGPMRFIDPGRLTFDWQKFENPSPDAASGKQALTYPTPVLQHVSFRPGMTCPVPACETEKFDREAAFTAHWQERHVNTLYGPCNLCLKQGIIFTISLARKSALNVHFRKTHPEVNLRKEESASFISVRRQGSNTLFIDPKPLHFDLPETLLELEAINAGRVHQPQQSDKPEAKVSLKCPEPGCESRDAFTAIDPFVAHWKDAHISKNQGPCMLCLKQSSVFPLSLSSMVAFKGHFSKHHPNVSLGMQKPDTCVLIESSK